MGSPSALVSVVKERTNLALVSPHRVFATQSTQRPGGTLRTGIKGRYSNSCVFAGPNSGQHSLGRLAVLEGRNSLWYTMIQ